MEKYPFYIFPPELVIEKPSTDINLNFSFIIETGYESDGLKFRIVDFVCPSQFQIKSKSDSETVCWLIFFKL